MFKPHPFDILFLTNFSDYCFRSIPAIAQMADVLKVRLTMMHVYDPARSSQAHATAQINNFFPEADRYTACHRIAVPGPIIETVQRHLKVWPVNVILAPASDALGFPRIGVPSLRSRLIKECGVPVWTIGRHVQLQRLTQPVRNVACWLDFYSLQTNHLAFAREYANRHNAKLHLLRALPDVDEGSLNVALQDKSLDPGLAAEEILGLCANNGPIQPEVHISCGDGRSAQARMLRKCDADLVFLHDKTSLLPEWLGLGSRLADSSPCPAIYVGDHLSIPVWDLEPGPGAPLRASEVARNGTRPRARLSVTGSHNGAGTAATAESWLSELELR